jgi:hypothetical protein
MAFPGPGEANRGAVPNGGRALDASPTGSRPAAGRERILRFHAFPLNFTETVVYSSVERLRQKLGFEPASA